MYGRRRGVMVGVWEGGRGGRDRRVGIRSYER